LQVSNPIENLELNCTDDLQDLSADDDESEETFVHDRDPNCYKSCKKSMVVGKVSEDRKQTIVEHILGMKETLVLLECLIQIGGVNIYKERYNLSL